MGLDMYLRARRSWPVDHELAEDLVNAAGISFGKLLEQADQDGVEDPAIYLPRWDFYRDSDAPGEREAWQHANDTITLAGLLDFCIAESEAGYIGLSDEMSRLYVEATCCYWRKVNHVHGWFVDNCQGGVDECQETPVSEDMLRQLASACEQVIESPGLASQLLPTRSGLFFGTYDTLDHWYFERLTSTISQINRVLDLASKVEGISFIYQSSW